MLEVQQEEKITAGGTERERARKRQQEPEGRVGTKGTAERKIQQKGRTLAERGGEKKNLPGIARGEQSSGRERV